MLLVATLIAAVLLSLVHVFVGKLYFLGKHPEIWKSAAGGVGISYTFLVLLPKLAAAQTLLERVTESGPYGFLVHHSYLVALAGLVIYYGLDAAAENVLVQPNRRTLGLTARLSVYLHASSLSGYYFLVSYLMSEAQDAGQFAFVSLFVFALAMLLHYFSLDHSLRKKYGGFYDRFMRWTFVAASLGGWIVASTTRIPYEPLALLTSLFAGVLTLFTLKEKLPGSGHVRFRPFLVGAAGYALLLLIIEVLEQSAS